MTPQRRDYPLSLSEAARILGVSKSKAYEMATAGDLPTRRDDLGRLRVHPSDLEPFLSAQAADAAAQPDLFGSGDSHRDRWLAALLVSDAPEGAKALGRFLHGHMDPETGEVEPQVVALLEAIRQGADQ